MRVGTHVHIGAVDALSQGSVHDRKLANIIVVPSVAAAKQVLLDHTGQRPVIFIRNADGTYRRYEYGG